MPYYIPVFFLTISAGCREINDQSSAEGCLGENLDSPDLLQATFTNFWATSILVAIARSLGFTSLDFLESHVVCLSSNQAEIVASDIKHIIDSLQSSGLPHLEGEFGSALDILNSEDLASTLNKAQAQSYIDEYEGDLLGFCELLVSLRERMLSSAQSGDEILYYAPEP